MAESRENREDSRQLFCRIITPESVVFDDEVDLVVTRIADGDIGVMVNSAPIVSTVGIRDVRITQGDDRQVFATSDGFFKVSENLVQILVEEAVPAEKIDVSAAEERVRDADNRLGKIPEDEENERARRAVEHERLMGENLVRVARRYGGA